MILSLSSWTNKRVRNNIRIDFPFRVLEQTVFKPNIPLIPLVVFPLGVLHIHYTCVTPHRQEKKKILETEKEIVGRRRAGIVNWTTSRLVKKSHSIFDHNVDATRYNINHNKLHNSEWKLKLKWSRKDENWKGVHSHTLSYLPTTNLIYCISLQFPP